MGRWHSSRWGESLRECPLDKDEGPLDIETHPRRSWPLNDGDAGVSNLYIQSEGKKQRFITWNKIPSPSRGLQVLYTLAPSYRSFHSASATSPSCSWVWPSSAHLRLGLAVTLAWSPQCWDLFRAHSFASFILLWKAPPETSLAPPRLHHHTLSSLVTPFFLHSTAAWDDYLFSYRFIACLRHQKVSPRNAGPLAHYWIPCAMTVPGTHVLDEQMNSGSLWCLQWSESSTRPFLGFSSSGINY